MSDSLVAAVVLLAALVALLGIVTLRNCAELEQLHRTIPSAFAR